jgi:small subunit ribosomal protein S16
MLSIRLKRVGSKNDPSFRIVVQDSRRAPKKTRGISEYLGSYDARKGKPQIDTERVKYWMSVGAKPTETVHNLLVDAKVLTVKKVNALGKKGPQPKSKDAKKK